MEAAGAQTEPVLSQSLLDSLTIEAKEDKKDESKEEPKDVKKE